MFFNIYCLILLVCVVYIKGVSIDEEVRSSTAFTFDMYRALFDVNKNLIVSPISFRIIFSLLYQLTSGESASELQRHMYFNEKSETLFSQRLTLEKLCQIPYIKVINKAYFKPGLHLKMEFLSNVNQYKSSVEQVDFTQKFETSHKINGWIEEQTNGLIKNIISEDNIDSSIALMLFNTLYLKARWLQPFNPENIFTREFNGYDGKNYMLDFMVDDNNRKVYTYNEIKSTILELPYEFSSNIKFWLILPNENSNITELIYMLSSAVIKHISDNIGEEQSAVLQIPLLNIESDIDGISILKKLGINKIFEDYEIDIFEGEKLRVDAVKQKTKILVNTEGTEAASVSYLKLSNRSAANLFRAVRPFIYMILTADTNEPLFVGHFTKPY